MQTQIKVMDLNLVQWEYLVNKVRVIGREFLPEIPRACVLFELNPGVSELHIEMDLVELACLMVRLASMDSPQAAAIPQPDQEARVPFWRSDR
jgi:hypothetical protein